MTMQATELLLSALKGCGVYNVFGIVGGEGQAIRFDEVEGINFYLTRHEFTAGVMADVMARLSGAPQVCYSTFGPGLTNMATGIFSAMQDRSPMLAISAQVPQKDVVFNQVHQCLDNVTFMKSITKVAKEVTDIAQIPAIVTELLQEAVNGIPGPVYLSIPVDVMMQTIERDKALALLSGISAIKPQPPAKHAEEEVFEQIIKTIEEAKNPLLIIGNQLIRNGQSADFEKFAENLNIPAICTLAAKGVLSQDHPLFIGTYNKYIDEIMESNISEQVFKERDLIILVGYDIGEDLKPSLWGDKKTILLNSHYVDVDKVFKPDMALSGELSGIFRALSERCPPKHSTGSHYKIPKPVTSPHILEQKLPVRSQHLPFIIDSFRVALGRAGILCSDIGLHKQYAGLLSDTFLPNTFMCSNVCGTFGFGLPSALAAKLYGKTRDLRVGLICGDGGFHSCSQDIETAVRYDLPLVILLLKDNAFGLIKYYQLSKYKKMNRNSVEFGNVNFSQLAEANGAKGYALNTLTSLPDLLEKTFASKEVCLIEVPLEYNFKLEEKF